MTEAEKKRRTRSAYRILHRIIDADTVKGPIGESGDELLVASALMLMGFSSVAEAAKEHLQNFEYEEDER